MTMELRVEKIELSKNGNEFSVLVSGPKNLWLDVVVSDRDVEADWNKYIFFENDADDMSIKAFQENLDNFENYSDTAINHLQEVGLIDQDDKANWFVVEFEVEDELYIEDDNLYLEYKYIIKDEYVEVYHNNKKIKHINIFNDSELRDMYENDDDMVGEYTDNDIYYININNEVTRLSALDIHQPY